MPIHHNTDQSRFEYTQDQLLCYVEYQLHNSILSIHHTYVPAALGGQGIAGALTKHVLEFAQTHQYQVRPVCSYTAAYMQRHPEYQALNAH